jgi:hypothetical protein
MQNNNPGNASTAQNPDADTPAYRDWREERREWRRERREARYRFPFRGLFGGLTLILLGTLFLLHQQGTISGGDWWQYLLIGLGGIFIINGLAHYWTPSYRWGSYGRFVAGIVLILIGTLFMLGFSQWWPLVLIVVGVALLLRFAWWR